MADLFIVKGQLKLSLWFVGTGFFAGVFAAWDAWRKIGAGGEGQDRFLLAATITGVLAVAWIGVLVAYLSAQWFMQPRINQQSRWSKIPWWVLMCVALLALISAMAFVLPWLSAKGSTEFTLLEKGRFERLRERIAENPELLKRTNRKTGNTLLEQALESGNPEAIELLLSIGADLAAVAGRINLSALLENPAMLETLLRNGVDPDAVDVDGFAPIHYAVETQNTNALVLLLDSEADVDARTALHQTPLLLAIMADDLPTTGILLGYGADPNAWDRRGETALHKAVRRRNPEGVRFLLEKGADPAVFSFSKMAPIHIAALNGQDELVELFLERPGMVGLRNDDDRTALDHALRGRRYDTAHLLIEHGADIDRTRASDTTALHRMLADKKYSVVRFLIEEGADVHIADSDGETAYDFMRRKQLQTLLDLVDARDNPPEPAATNAVDAAEAP